MKLLVELWYHNTIYHIYLYNKFIYSATNLLFNKRQQMYNFLPATICIGWCKKLYIYVSTHYHNLSWKYNMPHKLEKSVTHTIYISPTTACPFQMAIFYFIYLLVVRVMITQAMSETPPNIVKLHIIFL